MVRTLFQGSPLELDGSPTIPGCAPVSPEIPFKPAWRGKTFSERLPWPAVNLAALVDKDIGLTERALAKIKLAPPKRSHMRKIAEDFLTMARSYYEDAKHFRDKGELGKALANINYAHGWLDAGARVGLFDVGEDDQLFTLSE